jgi:hypothetical protein
LFVVPAKAGTYDHTCILLNQRATWSDIEALFRACGAEISEGSGSLVRIGLNGVRAVVASAAIGLLSS